MTSSASSAVPPRRVLVGGVPAVQWDATSCGAASVLVARGILDPAVGARLRDDPGRFADAQARVRAATARDALGPLPWPLALGTPPWTAARVLSTGTVRYRPVWLHGRDLTGNGIERVVARIAALTARGLPVPMYVGQPLLGRPPQRLRRDAGIPAAIAAALDRLPAVPRHVIVAVPGPRAAIGAGHADTALDVYAPGAGLVHRVTAGDLSRLPAAPDDPALLPARRALGGWTRLCVVLRPHVARGQSGAAGWGQETVGAERSGGARPAEEDV